ncbi:MAG: branched-chain amino acid aminotransferase [Saprospiraceae bacterium]|nr:branched-chain amino acid aminotransferase [Saprospiraceae bacterium]MBP7680025.1 branched-chain amino acid aminotransferase [Saprospiraceae bacterium]
MTNIAVTLSSASRLPSVDFNNIPFGRVFSDHMFVCDYIEGEWVQPRIIPFGNFEIHPANLALHYGQAIFEGMKVFKNKNDKATLFRPDANITRFNLSAKRMCMPTVPEDLFMDALHTLCSIEESWIPDTPGSSLYIRPYMFANGEFIGVAPSDVYRFIIFCCPVGPYYTKPVSLLVEEHYARAARGGVGEAKCAGNYAASLLPAKLAKEKGYDQVMWLDSTEFRYVQEVGTMNLFFVIDGKVVTPETEGTILKGITRDSFIKLLRHRGYEVQEAHLDIEYVAEAYRQGKLQEVFGAGTAALVAKVNKVTYRNLTMEFNVDSFKVADFLKSEIEAIRKGTVEDTFGWMMPIRTDVAQEV